MKKKMNLIKFVLFLLLIVSMVVGCQSNEDMTEDMSQEESYEDSQEDEISLDVTGKDQDLLIRSENVSDLIVNLYGIDNTTAIILNDRVAIGLEMADGFELTDDLRETVINTVLENDSMIRQVLITDNKKTFDQIESILESLMNGKPYDDHVKDIDRIMQNIK